MKISIEDKARESGVRGRHSCVEETTEVTTRQLEHVQGAIKLIKERLGPGVRNMVEVLTVRFNYLGGSNELYAEMRAVLCLRVLGMVVKIEVDAPQSGYSLKPFGSDDFSSTQDWIATDFVAAILRSLQYHRGKLLEDADEYVSAVKTLEELCKSAAQAALT